MIEIVGSKVEVVGVMFKFVGPNAEVIEDVEERVDFEVNDETICETVGVGVGVGVGV